MASSGNGFVPLSPRFAEALLFAESLHRHQVRKDGRTPYIAHLLTVAALVLEHEGSEEEAIAALLHDSLEDQSAHYPGGRAALSREIATRFGQPVLEIVLACTDDAGEEDASPPVARKHTWHQRKQRLLDSLAHASPAALRVIAADKLHNATQLREDLRQYGNAIWQRFHVADPAQQLAYYHAMARALANHLPGTLTRRLERTVASLQLATESME